MLKNKFVKWSFYVVCFLFCVFFFSVSCMTFRTSDGKVNKTFKKEGKEIYIQYDSIRDKSIRSICTFNKTNDKPLLVFVHGTPGSADNFFEYLKDSTLRSKSQMMTLDRPGYGYSEFGISYTSIKEQAATLKELVDLYKGERKVYMVGHSFGGPIICRLEADYPNFTNGLLLLAPALDPAHEKYFWFSKIGKWKLTRFFISKPLCVAGDEKYSHEEELKLLEPGLKNIHVPVIQMHGDRDKLVPYENLSYGENKMDSNYFEPVSMEGANHFIPWTKYDEVYNYINKLLDQE
jgi:pimeloyl-ACP methyl ester carboxylesterase